VRDAFAALWITRFKVHTLPRRGNDPGGRPAHGGKSAGGAGFGGGQHGSVERSRRNPAGDGGIECHRRGQLRVALSDPVLGAQQEPKVQVGGSVVWLQGDNVAEPLGVGSWRFVLDQVHDLVERVGNLRDETAWWGAVERNRDRELCHLHALGVGSPVLRGLRRVGPGGLVGGIERIVLPLHSAWRPFVQPDNRAAVTLRAVRRFGNGNDSLTRYIVKYEVKDREAAHIESGDIGRFLATAKVPAHTVLHRRRGCGPTGRHALPTSAELRLPLLVAEALAARYR
jgi:hypothetical protein